MLIHLPLNYPNNFGSVIHIGFEWIMCAVNLYVGFIVAHRTFTTVMCFIIIALIISMALIMTIKSKD
jgi:hypothetical protein